MRKILNSAVVKGLIICFIIVLCIAPFASSNPDGLERIAIDKGFHKNGQQSIIESIMPDYLILGINDSRLSTAAAGAVGVIITFGAFFIIGKIVTRPKKQ